MGSMQRLGHQSLQANKRVELAGASVPASAAAIVAAMLL